MSGTLRILHTADSHIGAGLPIRPRRDGPRRGDDLVRSYRRVLARAATENVDLVIHAGDLFDRSKPSSRALVAASEPLLALAVAGIPVIIVPGNHEKSSIPAALLLSHPLIHILAEPKTVCLNLRGALVAVSGFPCLRRDSARRFVDALDATGWSKAAADLRILAVHQTFESATCGPVNYRFRSGIDVVERGSIPSEFAYVAAGHIHRHQVLTRVEPEGPPIVYAGSPDRVSFAEADEPKGAVMVELNGCGIQHRFLEHEVRPLCVRPIDVTSLSRRSLFSHVDRVIRELPAGAIAQLRLTGSNSPYALRGLRLTGRAAELRPDVLLTATARAVELAPARNRVRPCRPSAFDELDAPPEPVISAAKDDLKALPAGCGVYALYDAAGRLLYVGKSKRVRARVRTHVRGETGAAFFDGWTRQIARVETREAHSELEALLMEAELIRILRPPFNRQMRRWKQYCYLHENGKPHGQLEVVGRLPPGAAGFGPYRGRKFAESVREATAAHFRLAQCPDEPVPDNVLSLYAEDCSARLCSRYFDGLCAGPCARRVTPADYARRVEQRHAFLSGTDDTTLQALEAEQSELASSGGPSNVSGEQNARTGLLRLAFNQAATRRAAEELTHGLLVLPGPDGRRKVAALAPRGILFDILRSDPGDAARVRVRLQRMMAKPFGEVDRRLPKSALDALCIAARQLCRSDGEYRFLPAHQVKGLDEKSLRAAAFESPPTDGKGVSRP